jgi:GR25 family glycosyltransferase involved in LPS biosynthesis
MSKKYCNKRNISKKEKQSNIFCINLEERIDRWIKVKEEVKKLGNNYKVIRVKAIKHKIPQYGLILTLAKLVKYAKKKDLKYIHFIEDDLLLHPHSKAIFENTFKNIPEDYDIFLGGSYWFQDMKKVTPGLTKVGDFSSLHFTIIKNTLYDEILELKNKIDNNELIILKNVDRYFGNMSKTGKINVYLSWPMFAKQEDDYSDMVSRKTDYNSIEFCKRNNLEFMNGFDL